MKVKKFRKFSRIKISCYKKKYIEGLGKITCSLVIWVYIFNKVERGKKNEMKEKTSFGSWASCVMSLILKLNRYNWNVFALEVDSRSKYFYDEGNVILILSCLPRLCFKGSPHSLKKSLFQTIFVLPRAHWTEEKTQVHLLSFRNSFHAIILSLHIA